MLSKVYTGSLYGLDSELITVETDLSVGLPALNLVGLADLTVRESRERIRAAILNSGYLFPMKRITVNLAPAGTRKEGTHFDLPIAMGVLTAAGHVNGRDLHKFALIGELSLDGKVNVVHGALPLVIGLRSRGIRHIFLPAANAPEAGMVDDVVLYPVNWLNEVAEHINGTKNISVYQRQRKTSLAKRKRKQADRPDFSDVLGQNEVKRAVQIAAAASHNLLLMGPPGAGKTMIARRIPTILPPMTYDESLEVTKLFSIAGELTEELPIVCERPFRAPHHSISQAALIGGGARPKPGELSLAHNGILFLDELPEFKRSVLELMRQPIEEGKVTIGRAAGHVTFPSRVMLVAAMNPCPCGYYGDPTHECRCRSSQIEAYRSKLSGPLLDRIDLQVEIMPVSYEAIFEQYEVSDKVSDGVNDDDRCANLPEQKEKKEENAEYVSSDGHVDCAMSGECDGSSFQLRQAVEEALLIQRYRYEKEEISCNSQLDPLLIHRYCKLDHQTGVFLKEAAVKLSFSARTCHKMMKVARTIADLAGSPNIKLQHMAEALRYRLNQMEKS